MAVLDRDRLNDALASLHMAGFGGQMRVLDGARGDLAAQLLRVNPAGSEGIDLNLGASPKDAAIVLVHAPGRGAQVSNLLSSRGVRDLVSIAPSGQIERAATDPAIPPTPGVDAGIDA